MIKKYNVITINLGNILMTIGMIFAAHILNTVVFIGFLPQLGYLILGYGLGFFLSPVIWYSIPGIISKVTTADEDTESSVK